MTSINKFGQLAGLVKNIKRTGWLRYLPAEHVESVGDHSAKIAMLALYLRNIQNVNYMKCMEMALIHDIAEGIVGDITPHCKVTPEEKFLKQKEACQKIFQSLGDQNGKYYMQVWLEYEEGQSYESKIVKDLDKLQMIQQAWVYEQKYNVNLSEFYECVPKMRTQLVRKWAEDLLEERKKKL